MTEPVIQTFNLTKRYGDFTAVDGVNLSLSSGETYGFLGPNGAGKTTTLMMILGILKPTAGKVHIFGQQLSSDPLTLKRRIGVMSEIQSFYEDMSAWEYLMFFGRLYEVENLEKRARQMMERVNLWNYRDVLLGGYSNGMQRKLGFTRALLHSPDILILDEPVSGLDPFGIVQIREILNEEHANGCTILLSSHILSEIERTATRVGIIVRGHLLIEDQMDHLRSKVSGKRRIELKLVENQNEIVEALQNLPFVLEVSQQDGAIYIDTPVDQDYSNDLGRALARNGAVVQGMRVVTTSLEEAFVTLTESSIRTLTGSDFPLERVQNDSSN